MALFFLRGKNIGGNLATFAEEEARHIKRVLRLKRGDTISAFDDQGKRYRLTIVDETAKTVIARIDSSWEVSSDRRVDILLGVGVPKGDRFDYILQKSTELGVTEIVPFLSSRTVVKVLAEKKASRILRWRRIILEAVKQCGSPHIPQLEELCTFPGVLKRTTGCDLKIMLYEESFDFSLKRILEEREQVNSVALLVGPEGGFSKEEVGSARESGFAVAGLGSNILRVETAAVAALAMIQYRFENL